MKKLLFLAAILVGSLHANAECPEYQFNFIDLPFIEGKLYVAVRDGDTEILMTCIEVENEEIIIPIDLTPYLGKTISVQGFQDLNDNRQLDSDQYGRPTEPCIQNTITPTDTEKRYWIKLIQY